MAEIIHAAIGLLPQQVALDQRLHGVEQLFLGLAGDLEKRVEVEAAAEDRGGFERRTQLFGYMRKTHANCCAQRVGKKSRPTTGTRVQTRFPLAQRLQNGDQKKRVAFGFIVQTGGQAGRTGIRLCERRNQGRGVAGRQPGQR